jgi:hypothetical protein
MQLALLYSKPSSLALSAACVRSRTPSPHHQPNLIYPLEASIPCSNRARPAITRAERAAWISSEDSPFDRRLWYSAKILAYRVRIICATRRGTISSNCVSISSAKAWARSSSTDSVICRPRACRVGLSRITRKTCFRVESCSGGDIAFRGSRLPSSK